MRTLKLTLALFLLVLLPLATLAALEEVTFGPVQTVSAGPMYDSGGPPLTPQCPSGSTMVGIVEPYTSSLDEHFYSRSGIVTDITCRQIVSPEVTFGPVQTVSAGPMYDSGGPPLTPQCPSGSTMVGIVEPYTSWSEEHFSGRDGMVTAITCRQLSVTVTWTDESTAAPTCSIWFDQSGDTTTVHWSSTDLGPTDTFDIDPLGNGVPAAGSAQTSQTGTYSGTLKRSDGFVLGSCSATLGGGDDDDDGGGGNYSCNSSNQCVADPNGSYTSSNCNNACGGGTGTQCLPPRQVIGGVCRCQSGFTWQNNQCVAINCPDGWTLQNEVCVAPDNITFNHFDALDRNGDSFTATGHLLAFPSLVRQGQSTQLYWSVSNVQGCTVTGNNESWNTRNSGPSGETTGAINAQTIYTLQCQALLGATPAMVQETATVNIIPLFEEI